MNILLTAINAKYIHSNLAVYSLRAYAAGKCEKYKEEIGIAEYTINQPLDQILMDLYKRKPEVLCFSCYLWNIEYVEQLVAELGKIMHRRISGLVDLRFHIMRLICWNNFHRYMALCEEKEKRHF